MEKNNYGHPLMSIHLDLLQISNRAVEEIEKKRLDLVRNCSDEEKSVAEFKEFVFQKLLKVEKSGVWS